MPQRCDICGISALEGQEFAQERLPFCRARRYCPACHKRFYLRVYAVVAIVPLVFAILGIWEVRQGHKRLLDSVGIWYALLVLFQWLMIPPHELGHAIVARLLGYTQIRIMVGAGKPLLSFRFLGFSWLLNLIPFGGITLFKLDDKPSRWKYFAVIAAGPAVNIAAAVTAWLFVPPGGFFDHTGTVAKLFFWANAIVLAENLIPQVFQTPYGPTGSDGLKLWTILFRWNKLPSTEPAPVPLWELILCYFLKWTVFLITLSATLLLAIVSVLVLIHSFTGVALGARALVAAVILAVSFVSGWVTFRIAREPIARTRKPLAAAGLFNRGLSHSTEQRELLTRAAQELAQGRFGEAEKLADELIASVPDVNSAAYANLLLAKLDCILNQNDFDRAEKTWLDFIKGDIAIQQKIKILDGFACRLLYQPSSPFVAHAEKFIRLALELAPGTLTLLGTLGGILAEQGKFAEAEPFLRECLSRSPAVHDQGISSFYLGVVSLGTGNAKEAKRLIKRGMLMYPEPWLLTKAKNKLKGLEETSNCVFNAK